MTTPPIRRFGLHRLRNILLEKALFKVMFGRTQGQGVFTQDWQNLIILDACRYDVFRSALPSTSLRGELSCVISKGTETQEFLRANFPNTKYDDIVYVSANPFASKLLEGKVHEIIPVWLTSWDEAHQTVLPESMYKAAVSAYASFPGKKLIVHFLQPHHPYIGYRPPVGPLDQSAPLYVYCAKEWFPYHSQLFRSPLMRHLYRQNLNYALPWVEKLVSALPGVTIITADHGEAFGERVHPLIPVKIYGHIEYARIPSLVKVPWFVVEGGRGSGPRIDAAPAARNYLPEEDEQVLEERLKALGYS